MRLTSVRSIPSKRHLDELALMDLTVQPGGTFSLFDNAKRIGGLLPEHGHRKDSQDEQS